MQFAPYPSNVNGFAGFPTQRKYTPAFDHLATKEENLHHLFQQPKGVTVRFLCLKATMSQVVYPEPGQIGFAQKLRRNHPILFAARIHTPAETHLHIEVVALHVLQKIPKQQKLSPIHCSAVCFSS
ncbi:hypothetical protein ACFO3I_03055 [Rheinheimera marina]|uniref:Uncharacterized protein n=1 Tax=Rheinheimera marina TaxID=1774958 RepID=A0ABV9JH16_9GAMM